MTDLRHATFYPPSTTGGTYHVCRSDPCDHRPAVAPDEDVDAWLQRLNDAMMSDLDAVEADEDTRHALALIDAHRDIIDRAKAWWRHLVETTGEWGLTPEAAALGAAVGRLTDLEGAQP